MLEQVYTEPTYNFGEKSFTADGGLLQRNGASIQLLCI